MSWSESGVLDLRVMCAEQRLPCDQGCNTYLLRNTASFLILRRQKILPFLRGLCGPAATVVPCLLRRAAQQEQPGPRPGHPREQQPALLGQVWRGHPWRAGNPEREPALLAAGQEDRLELLACQRRPVTQQRGGQLDQRPGPPVSPLPLRSASAMAK